MQPQDYLLAEKSAIEFEALDPAAHGRVRPLGRVAVLIVVLVHVPAICGDLLDGIDALFDVSPEVFRGERARDSGADADDGNREALRCDRRLRGGCDGCRFGGSRRGLERSVAIFEEGVSAGADLLVMLRTRPLTT